MGSEVAKQQATSSLSAARPLRLEAVKRDNRQDVKSTIHLSLEASQRLDIHATMMNLDRSVPS